MRASHYPSGKCDSESSRSTKSKKTEWGSAPTGAVAEIKEGTQQKSPLHSRAPWRFGVSAFINRSLLSCPLLQGSRSPGRRRGSGRDRGSARARRGAQSGLPCAGGPRRRLRRRPRRRHHRGRTRAAVGGSSCSSHG